MLEESYFSPVERLPLGELETRHERCRENLMRLIPSAGGVLVMGAPNLYYMTGTAANGLLWLPLEGTPVLAVRKAAARAKMESPLATVASFRSYAELGKIFAAFDCPLTEIIAVDQAGVSWEQGQLLSERLAGHALLAADAVLARTRALKSEWELIKMREAGRMTHIGHMELAGRIRPGMSEYAIAQELWSLYAQMGSSMVTQTGTAGAGMMLGHFCAGVNGNHPSAYDGPLGVMGVHPATPVMGSRGAVWQKKQILSVDAGAAFEGYISDRTQIYFSGPENAIPAIARKAHEVCVLILDATAAMLRPGGIPSEIYAKSLEIAEKNGFAEQFMGLGENKVRFIGHGIGLTISEWPICARGFSEPLQTGMTMALEPKIGLPGIGMVGVENTYEITVRGAVSLTGNDTGVICVDRA